jgi:endogenous inhibitor of DNA gyrase (YacG/DUF329 family)
MGNMRVVGHVRCPKCGHQNITDTRLISIFFALDAMQQVCTVKCPSCALEIDSKLDPEDFLKFRTHGVKMQPLSAKFKPLTEAEIDEWDIEKDLKNVFV